MLNAMRPCVCRWAVTVVAAATLIATLPLSNSRSLALHIQPRVLGDHWLVHDMVADTTEEIDQISTTPQDFDTTEIFPTTMIPTTTEGAMESDTLLPSVDAVLPKSSGLPWNIDVDDLLINIPSPICPQGYRSDLRGKCRQMFGFPTFRQGYQEMLPLLPGPFVNPKRPHSNALS